MKVLVVYAHPVETSFNAALHRAAVEALTTAGHQVDDCDLYAEGFQPVLSREERLGYHDESNNQRPVASYVERLQNADALVLCFPTWIFGPPAILKGFFDRVFLPGVCFEINDRGKVVGKLNNIRKLAAVVTYGGNRWRALLAGDPPRRVVCRAIRAYTNFNAPVRYLARYDMNNMTEAKGRRFIAKVRREMLSL